MLQDLLCLMETAKRRDGKERTISQIERKFLENLRDTMAEELFPDGLEANMCFKVGVLAERLLKQS